MIVEWFNQHTGLIQAVMSATTAIIWLVYLHAILSGYRRQRRATIIITATGHGLNARCFVANLGLEPVNVLGVVIDSELDGVKRRTDIAELNGSAEDSTQISKSIPHGPLTSGAYADIGTFKQLCGLTRPSDDHPRPNEGEIIVTVIATTAADSYLAGAKRTFFIEAADEGGPPYLRADSAQTKQIRSRSGRRQLESALGCYNDDHQTRI